MYKDILIYIYMDVCEYMHVYVYANIYIHTYYICVYIYICIPLYKYLHTDKITPSLQMANH